MYYSLMSLLTTHAIQVLEIMIDFTCYLNLILMLIQKNDAPIL